MSNEELIEAADKFIEELTRFRDNLEGANKKAEGLLTLDEVKGLKPDAVVVDDCYTPPLMFVKVAANKWRSVYLGDGERWFGGLGLSYDDSEIAEYAKSHCNLSDLGDEIIAAVNNLRKEMKA